MEWHEAVYKTVEYDIELWRRIKEKVIERDNCRCLACGRFRKKKELTAHHILPRSEGGKDDFDNLVAICDDCHDYVEDMGFRTRIEIINCTRNLTLAVDDEIIEVPEKEKSLDWHEYVYGGKRR